MADFYVELPLGVRNQRVLGQICRAPAPMVSSRVLALRLGALKVGENLQARDMVGCALTASEFGNLSESDRVDMRKKMPIPELALAVSEELTVVKAKMRPAVLLYRDCLNERRQASFLSGRGGRKPEPARHLFAPIYSLRKDNGETDYPAEFVEMVRAGDFPNILFLPAFRNPIIFDSMLVLTDQFQAGINMVEPTDLGIDPLTLSCTLSRFEDLRMGLADEIADALAGQPPAENGKTRT